MYYGVSQVPRTSIDGFLRNEAQFSTWGTPVYNKRVLLQSPFEIKITYPENPAELLNISAEITALEKVDSSLIVQVVVVEREIPASVFINVNLGNLTFRNVVKRMLPDAAGTRINQVWQQGSRVVVNQSWNPVNVYDRDKLAVVVFLQNEQNKSVYQAFLSNVSTRPLGVTSLPTELLQSFVLYPNPTRDKIIVGFEGINVLEDYEVKVFDQLGRLVKETSIIQGEQGVVVDVGNLAEGMYLLRLQNEKGELLTRKFSVLR
ncbi:MAG: T9SS type A sorting domain-containing protein [Raineya sp.]